MNRSALLPRLVAGCLITTASLLAPSPALAAPDPATPDSAEADPAVDPAAGSTPAEIVTPRLTAWSQLSANDPDAASITGFSAAASAGGGTFWMLSGNDADPDAPLQLHLVRPGWQHADGGPGQARVLDTVTLSDPRHRIAVPIRNEDTRTRLLTRADVDPGSLQPDRDGSWWIGDQNGPSLLHVNHNGKLLETPIAVPSGGGFAAMARSRGGRFLYPVQEQARPGAPDPRARVISEFDTRRGRFTSRSWTYHADTDANLVADAQVAQDGRLVILERDSFAGPAAFSKRIYRVDLDVTEADGVLAKDLVADLLKLDNPARLGPEGGWGTGAEFSFGLRAVDAMVVLSRGRVLVANDSRPDDHARRPDQPDGSELIILDPSATAPPPLHPGTLYAHRGASGYRPEHTLAGYALAIRQCADVIEPDVVMTSDGVPVVRHENEIAGRRNSDGAVVSGGTTDVDQHPEFAARLKAKGVDGDPDRTRKYWYTEDFTLAELRTLRARERIPETRPANSAFDGLYPVPTLAEVLDLARHSRSCTGGPIAVAPETKHPSYFAGIGLPIEPALLRALTAAGLNHSGAPVIIQSFETQNLKTLATQTEVPLLQLINCSGRPWDFTVVKDKRTYADLAKPAGLAEIAQYADAVGLCKNLIIPRTATGALAAPTPVVADAHAAGLQVVGWTFRRENQFLPLDFRSGTDPYAPGDLAGEITAFLSTGMDGYFTDNPDIGSSLALT